MATTKGNNKMKVEIWSDIMCPFCYIGKRNYEKALKQFPEKDHIEVVWKSFQLDPTITSDANGTGDVYEYLSVRKGISRDQVINMHAQVTLMAQEAGLEYHLDKTIIANSFKAHRLIQFAKQKGLGDEAEERLFYANFTEGKDFGDPIVLQEIALEIGLTKADVEDALTTEEYADLVRGDLREAREIGVNGVPFFVFDRKYAINGAQKADAFLQALEKSFGEWRKENLPRGLDITHGSSCSIDDKCE